MTIMDAITRIDTLKPNRYEQIEKIKWLGTLDDRIKLEIIDTHEDSENIAYDGYSEESSLSTVLLAPSPYDELYLSWLEAQIDYWNGETKKYNNSIEMFNAAYAEYASHYHRAHTPKGKKLCHF